MEKGKLLSLIDSLSLQLEVLKRELLEPPEQLNFTTTI
jgi:hypothetical protein